MQKLKLIREVEALSPGDKITAKDILVGNVDVSEDDMNDRE